MDKPALVRDGAIAAAEDVIGDRLSEDLDLEHVGDDLLRLAVDVWMHECDVVVARDDVPERGQPLFHPLDGHGVREGVAQVLELLVGRCRWDKEAMSVSCIDGSGCDTQRRGSDVRTCGQTTHYARASDAGVDDRDDIPQLALEGRVKVCAALDGSQTVAVRQL